MQRRRVVITGVGVVSPVGNNTKQFWQSLLEGKSGVGQITKFDTTGFSSTIAAEVKNFDASDLLSSKEQRRMDDFVKYALVAADEAIKSSGLELEKMEHKRAGCIVGSGIGGLQTIENQHKVLLEKGPGRISPFLIPMLIVNMAPGQIAINYKLKGPNYAVVTACASSNNALGDAFRVIQEDKADIIVSGGTESSITPLGVAGFCSAKALSTRNDEPEKACRPFDRERDGFIMAEGAAIVILEELEHARKRGVHILAEMVGFGASCDAYHMTAPDPSGEGAAESMRLALKSAGISAAQLDYINAHGTSTKLNDAIETKAIKAVLGKEAEKVAVSSTKSMTGHMLGAAGGIEAIATCLALKEGIIPPTINYEFPDPECDLDYVPNKPREQAINYAASNGLGFGGHNATLVFKKYE